VKNLRPIDGIFIFGISYLLSVLATAGISRFLSARTVTLISIVILAGVAFFLLKMAVGQPLRYVGVRRAGPRLILYTILASLSIIVPVMSLEAVTLFRFKIPQEIIDALNEIIKARTVPELLYVLLIVAVGAAVSEEFVFRGILQRSLASRFGAWAAILITSLVFALLHTIWRLPPALILGVFLGVLYWRTQSLVLPMISHFTINSAAVIALFVAEKRGEASMPLWIREEKPAPIWMTVVSLALFFVFLRAIWRQGAPTVAQTEPSAGVLAVAQEEPSRAAPAITQEEPSAEALDPPASDARPKDGETP
jgi:membrane protease YdiL (CAAX protease family)